LTQRLLPQTAYSHHEHALGEAQSVLARPLTRCLGIISHFFRLPKPPRSSKDIGCVKSSSRPLSLRSVVSLEEDFYFSGSYCMFSRRGLAKSLNHLLADKPAPAFDELSLTSSVTAARDSLYIFSLAMTCCSILSIFVRVGKGTSTITTSLPISAEFPSW